VPIEGCPDIPRIGNCSVKRGNLYNNDGSLGGEVLANLYGNATVTENVGVLQNPINGVEKVWTGDQNSPQFIGNHVIGLQPNLSAFVGMFGLSGDKSQDPTLSLYPQFLEEIMNSSRVAVNSWSYTAGSFTR
jgi:hypothetical protein